MATTLCLVQYRMWFFTFRRPEPFVPPPEFTTEQCEAAKVVHGRIQAEQAAQREADEAERVLRAADDEWRRKEDWERRNREQEAERERAAKAAAATDTKYRREQVKARAEAEAQAKKPGARIGMTREQVINETSWGKPTRVHRTTTARGTTEQWVYSDSNYLYFENGRLTAAQH